MSDDAGASVSAEAGAASAVSLATSVVSPARAFARC